MRIFYILTSLAVLTSGSPQNRAIFFPDDVDDTNIDDIEHEDTIDEDDDYGEYEYDAYAELEDFGFDGDYVELPEWMDTDLDEIPLDKLALLNNVTELTELTGIFELDLDYFSGITKENQSDPGLDSRSADPSSSNEVSKDNLAQFARCQPENVTVLFPSSNKNTLYMPSCVRLMQCGGCCNNKLLSCQPTKVENVTLTVLKISKRSNKGSSRSRRRRSRKLGKKVSMVMQNHIECSCDCKVKEKDCHPDLHNYNKAGCSCECKNGEEEMECQKSSGLHKWDKKLCSCMCRKQKECSTGEEFSQKTCGCVTAIRDDA